LTTMKWLAVKGERPRLLHRVVQRFGWMGWSTSSSELSHSTIRARGAGVGVRRRVAFVIRRSNRSQRLAISSSGQLGGWGRALPV